MPTRATLADLLLRASADDLARAASRDQPATVTGELLRRAAEEPQPLDADALRRLRAESTETLYAGASADRDFEGAEFTESSTTGTVAAPDYGAASYVAVAVPAAASPVEEIYVGAGLFDQISAFAGPSPVRIGGVDCVYWRTSRPWGVRSAGVKLRVEPFGGGEAVWDGDAVDALPATLARIQAALEDADAEIDGRIGPRYHDAVATRTLTAKAVDLAVFGIVGGEPDSEEARRWDAALRWLRDVAAGRVDLESPEPATDDAPSAAAPPSVFGAGALDDYLQWRRRC